MTAGGKRATCPQSLCGWRLRVARWVPPAERTIHVLGRSFDAAFTDALARKARAERTSVHGALAAAICMAVAGDQGISKPTTVLYRFNRKPTRSPGAPVGEEGGFYVGFSEFREQFSATSFAGRLQLNAMWPEPSLEEPQARAIVGDVVARLEAAVDWEHRYWRRRDIQHRSPRAQEEVSTDRTERDILTV